MSRPILFVGDIHLGRSPHRLAKAGFDPTRLNPETAWRRVVRYAVDNDVQAVVLAGDVVDQDKDRFQAFWHLQRGVGDLINAGIRAIGVAGNHDHVAFPRLVERISQFELLGAGGTWERLELEGVDLIGWSFPSNHFEHDPLQSEGLTEAIRGKRAGVLTLGVLHAALDSGPSVYAPVRSSALAQLDVAGWFLGHIHSPSLGGSERPLGYLGSLVGLDRGETGPRGPWMVHAETPATVRLEQVPLGPVHWTEFTVDLSETTLEGDSADDLIHSAIGRQIATCAQEDAWVRAGDFSAVGCSVRFVGRVKGRARVSRFLVERGPQDLIFEKNGVPWVVVSMSDETRPDFSIAQLSEEKSPLGRLARLRGELESKGVDAIPKSVIKRLKLFDPSLWVDDEDHIVPDTLASTIRVLDQILEQLLAQRSISESD